MTKPNHLLWLEGNPAYASRITQPSVDLAYNGYELNSEPSSKNWNYLLYYIDQWDIYLENRVDAISDENGFLVTAGSLTTGGLAAIGGNITSGGVAVPTISSTSTFTNKSLQDSTTFFIDNLDATKRFQFQASSISTATTRTFTLPDVDGTLLTTGTVVSIAQGGTGQTTANAALNALLPSQASAAGKILASDGTNTAWAAALTSTLTDGYIFVGDATNTAVAVIPSGDITMTNAGVFSIASGVIMNGDINASAGIAGTKVSPAFGSQNISTTGTLASGAATLSGITILGPTGGGTASAANAHTLQADAVSTVLVNNTSSAATSVAINMRNGATVRSRWLASSTNALEISDSGVSNTLFTLSQGGAISLTANDSTIRSANAANNAGAFIGHRQSDGVALWGAVGSSSVVWRVNSADVGNISTAGAVTFGPSAGLGAAGFHRMYGPTGAANPAVLVQKVIGSDASSNYYMQFDTNTATQGYIWNNASGNLEILTASDLSLKDNVRDADYGLEQVMALRPVTFDWKSGSAIDVRGFIAQEVREVLPRCVSEGPDGLLNLGKDEFIPLLVAAMQQQQTLIESLKDRIESLEAA